MKSETTEYLAEMAHYMRLLTVGDATTRNAPSAFTFGTAEKIAIELGLIRQCLERMVPARVLELENALRFYAMGGADNPNDLGWSAQSDGFRLNASGELARRILNLSIPERI